ncbi:MAG: hypothetical protein ACO2OR_06485 [Desulfurococcaceae archaeon]
MCRVLKILDSPTMKPFIVRDCEDSIVIEIDGLVLVMNRRLEKLVVVSEKTEEAGSSNGCLGSC